MGNRSALILLLSVLSLSGLFSAPAAAQTAFAPFNVPVPEPRNLDRFVVDRAAGIQLGKALFWDMQVGSDGMTACATCHHHAGTDSRTRNTLHPGGDGVFGADRQPNSALQPGDFPFVQFATLDDPNSQRTVRRDDRVGAQGVNKTRSLGIREGQEAEPGRIVRDGDFHRHGRNVRQSTGRNAPTTINAVFNFANFLDGRANHFFNGVDPFGPLNRSASVYRNVGGTLVPISLTADMENNPYVLDNASLASQAVGPVLNDVEMSWGGRSWPEVGRKILSLRPLAKQEVHAQDSSLAPLRHGSGKGLATTYGDLIKTTFQAEFWNGPEAEGGYSHLESNFALFFGLALQLYQATLVADRSPFDLFNIDPASNPLSASAERGRQIFLNVGCTNCHIGPEMTGASVSFATNPLEAGLIEIMRMGDNQLASYDIGFYNIGVTPTSDDRGRGSDAPPSITLTNGQPMPLAFSHQFFAGEALLGFAPLARPGCVNDFLAEPPTICDDIAVATSRVAVDGAFKTPGLRNVELTGPYMHDGGMLTLMQVVDFYVRGGNFSAENLADLDPEMNPLATLRGNEAQKRDLVDFLLALTDERVRWERAPFDHPQLIIPNGHTELVPGNPKRTRILADDLTSIVIPAVGRNGGTAPLRPFLGPTGYDQAVRGDSFFHYQH
ncbi:MAG: cytochrome C peroxidase [Desulfuromonadales bacterium]|nr:cytochrome C peroxidase [Desulfuromonadales bacterium]